MGDADYDIMVSRNPADAILTQQNTSCLHDVSLIAFIQVPFERIATKTIFKLHGNGNSKPQAGFTTKISVNAHTNNDGVSILSYTTNESTAIRDT